MDDDNVLEDDEEEEATNFDYFWAVTGMQYWHKLVSIVSLVASSSIDPQMLTNFCSELNRVWQLVYYLVTLIAVDNVFKIGYQLPRIIFLQVFWGYVNGALGRNPIFKFDSYTNTPNDSIRFPNRSTK